MIPNKKSYMLNIMVDIRVKDLGDKEWLNLPDVVLESIIDCGVEDMDDLLEQIGGYYADIKEGNIDIDNGEEE